MKRAAYCQRVGALSAGITWLVRSPWRSFLVLFLLSFWPRFSELSHMPAVALIPNAGRELGAIALSLMQSAEFANPYALPTGPTAHLPPLYPLLVSRVYRFFRLTPAAGFVSGLLIAIAASGVMLLTLLAAWGLWLNFRTLTIPQRAALIVPLATYPLIYYFVAHMPRYRVPIDWILFVLAGSLAWRAIGGFGAWHSVESPYELHPSA